MEIVGLLCWRTIEDGLSIFSTACVVWDCKEELGVRLFRAVPDGQEIFMGAGWTTSHS